MALVFFQYSPEARLGSVSGTQYILSTINHRENP